MFNNYSSGESFDICTKVTDYDKLVPVGLSVDAVNQCDSEISVPYLQDFRKIKYPRCQRSQINLLL